VRPPAILVATLAVALFSVSPALAAVELGEVAPPGTGDTGSASVTNEIQLSTASTSPSYAAPSNGVITSWRVNAGTATGLAELKVYRSTATSNQFRIVGVSGPQTVMPGSINSFQTRIPVLARDRLGLKVNGNTVVNHPGAENDVIAFIADGNSGDTVSTSVSGGPVRINVAATLEPDRDGDGFGDETQDGCPTDAASQGLCAADVAATLTAAPANALRRGQVTYIFTARNTNAANAARNVRAQIVLPPHVRVRAGGVSNPLCERGRSDGRDRLDCTFAELPGGSSMTVSIVARARTVGEGLAEASISSETVDANGENDAASVGTTATWDAERACARANRVRGSGRKNRITGTEYGDPLLGLGRADVLSGLAGDDCLFGGRGRDTLIGADGDDRLVGGKGRDGVSGGAGKDTILAADRWRDTIDCGSGRDSVVVDRRDRIRHCERVRVRRSRR
jgi:hypothetical protein